MNCSIAVFDIRSNLNRTIGIIKLHTLPLTSTVNESRLINAKSVKLIEYNWACFFLEMARFFLCIVILKILNDVHRL